MSEQYVTSGRDVAHQHRYFVRSCETLIPVLVAGSGPDKRVRGVRGRGGRIGDIEPTSSSVERPAHQLQFTSLNSRKPRSKRNRDGLQLPRLPTPIPEMCLKF